MYHTDSPSRDIRVYDYNKFTGDVTGVSNSFVQIPSRKIGKTLVHPVPDGSIIDSSGNLWNSEWDGSRVVLYKANSSADRFKYFYVSYPSFIFCAYVSLSVLQL
jgi:L-arabinonolactonase